MRSCDRTVDIRPGCRTCAGTLSLAASSIQQGERPCSIALVSKPNACCFSLDGEVKLWDIRGHDGALDVWEMRPENLEAFDVHVQSGVFGMYVSTLSSMLTSPYIFFAGHLRSTPHAGGTSTSGCTRRGDLCPLQTSSSRRASWLRRAALGPRRSSRAQALSYSIRRRCYMVSGSRMVLVGATSPRNETSLANALLDAYSAGAGLRSRSQTRAWRSGL